MAFYDSRSSSSDLSESEFLGGGGGQETQSQSVQTFQQPTPMQPLGHGRGHGQPQQDYLPHAASPAAVLAPAQQQEGQQAHHQQQQQHHHQQQQQQQQPLFVLHSPGPHQQNTSAHSVPASPQMLQLSPMPAGSPGVLAANGQNMLTLAGPGGQTTGFLVAASAVSAAGGEVVPRETDLPVDRVRDVPLILRPLRAVLLLGRSVTAMTRDNLVRPFFMGAAAAFGMSVGYAMFDWVESGNFNLATPLAWAGRILPRAIFRTE